MDGVTITYDSDLKGVDFTTFNENYFKFLDFIYSRCDDIVGTKKTMNFELAKSINVKEDLGSCVTRAKLTKTRLGDFEITLTTKDYNTIFIVEWADSYKTKEDLKAAFDYIKAHFSEAYTAPTVVSSKKRK